MEDHGNAHDPKTLNECSQHLDNNMTYFDKLPPDVRKAFREAAYSWCAGCMIGSGAYLREAFKAAMWVESEALYGPSHPQALSRQTGELAELTRDQMKIRRQFEKLPRRRKR
jgi:hypothetical protein